MLPASAVDALLALLPQFLLVSKNARRRRPAGASAPSNKSAPRRAPAATILRRWEKVSRCKRTSRSAASASLTMQCDYYANCPGGGCGAMA